MSKDPPSPGQSARQAAAKIVLLYAVFGALWILLSDKAVEWAFDDPQTIVLASTIKGWAFIAVTSLLLLLMLRRFLRGNGPGDAKPASDPQAPAGHPQAAPPEGSPHLASLRPVVLPVALLVAAIVVIVASNVVYTFRRHEAKEVQYLQAVADLRSQQVSTWLKDWDGDTHVLSRSSYLAGEYTAWRHGDPAGLDRFLRRLEDFRRDNAYRDVLLFDEAGTLVWNSMGEPVAPTPLAAAARRAVAEARVIRLDPYRSSDGRVQLDFAVPLAPAPNRPVAAVVLRVDPETFLFPTLRNWPVPSPSGETLLFRRDGDAVLYLNELRHRSGTAARLRVPLAEKRVLASQVLRKDAPLGSVIEGVDYRHVPALGVARRIPGTDWYLIAKMDRQEVYAEAVQDSITITLAGLLAVFASVVAVILFRQRRELRFSSAVRREQAEKLRALRLLDAIAESSTDAIFALDLQGRFILFNRAAAQFNGKTLVEVLGRDERALFPAAMAEKLMADNRRVIAEDRALTFEDDLVTAAGERTFLTTKGPLRDADGRVIGILGIARDVTERKRMEDSLRARNEELDRFNRAVVGRELDMIRLKREINALCVRLGDAPPYPLAFLGDGGRNPAPDPAGVGHPAGDEQAA